MRVLLDACVLFPTVMREVLLGAAAEGAFQPLWSARILEEWARATRKLPEGSEGIARAEIALMKADWPEAMVEADPALQTTIWLPDADDIHVLAAAIAGKADVLLTLNRQDFPTRILAGRNILRRDPDGVLCEFAIENSDAMRRVVAKVITCAERASGRPQPTRPLLKRAGMPRLARLMAEA